MKKYRKEILIPTKKYRKTVLFHRNKYRKLWKRKVKPGHSNSRDFKFTQIPLNQVGVFAGKNMLVLTFRETIDLSELSREGVVESDMSVFVAMDDQCKILESVARRLENISN